MCLSGLRHNKRFNWHSSPYKRVTGSSPGKYLKEYIDEKIKVQARMCRKRLFSDNVAKIPKKKVKMYINHKRNTDYGPNAEEFEDDLVLAQEVEEVINRLKVINTSFCLNYVNASILY